LAQSSDKQEPVAVMAKSIIGELANIHATVYNVLALGSVPLCQVFAHADLPLRGPDRELAKDAKAPWNREDAFVSMKGDEERFAKEQDPQWQ
jgi:hypothetical protein